MVGFEFSDYVPKDKKSASFEKIYPIFKELILALSGKIDEALSYLNEVDKRYQIFDDNYRLSDFINDLIDKKLIELTPSKDGKFIVSKRLELNLRKQALKDVFGKLKKSKKGNHNSKNSGQGIDKTNETKPFAFGDSIDKISMTESIKNAQINRGVDSSDLHPEDLEVYQTYKQEQTATVLMIDISHSMILYGEDRITPAKRVALALSEYIKTRFPKDSLDIVVFGNDAWEVELKDLPYLEVGPFHTNTVAGLELALNILKRRKKANKQIFMITDGKPTCIKIGKRYFKDSVGLNKKIVKKTLALATKCRKLDINVTTFMIASDPYLMKFIDAFTEACQGKALYPTLDGLGDALFLNFKDSRKKRR